MRTIQERIMSEVKTYPVELDPVRASASTDAAIAPSPKGSVYIPYRDAQQEMLKVLLSTMIVTVPLLLPGAISMATGTYHARGITGSMLVLSGADARWMGACRASMGMFLLGLLLPLRRGLVWSAFWLSLAAISIYKCA